VKETFKEAADGKSGGDGEPHVQRVSKTTTKRDIFVAETHYFRLYSSEGEGEDCRGRRGTRVRLERCEKCLENRELLKERRRIFSAKRIEYEKKEKSDHYRRKGEEVSRRGVSLRVTFLQGERAESSET